MSSKSTGIKIWKPTYDYIVALALTGNSHAEIAAIVGLSKDRVSHVLADPKAKDLIERSRLEIVGTVIEGIGGRLLEAAEVSMTRLEETLNQPIPANSRAKVHQDNVALDILKGTGFLRKDHAEDPNSKSEKLTEKTVQRLTRSLEKANEVMEKHGSSVYDPEYEEGDFEIVETTNGEAPKKENPSQESKADS